MEGEWDRLELLYGVDNIKRARGYAEIVYEESNPKVIEDIIKRIDTFGEKRVKAAFDIAAKKSPANPKRCYPYVKGIMDKWERRIK
ncbi:MAG: hypothetical protein KKA80_04130 [Candidatus Omnitrophica bacterium]|nr:hypothetical protein [Candidatus Omnitrophota bacterium]